MDETVAGERQSVRTTRQDCSTLFFLFVKASCMGNIESTFDHCSSWEGVVSV